MVKLFAGMVYLASPYVNETLALKGSFTAIYMSLGCWLSRVHVELGAAVREALSHRSGVKLNSDRRAQTTVNHSLSTTYGDINSSHTAVTRTHYTYPCHTQTRTHGGRVRDSERERETWPLFECSSEHVKRLLQACNRLCYHQHDWSPS